MSEENQTQTMTLDEALEALKSVRQQAASYRTKHANAQNTIQRLSAALSAAGLDPESDTLEQDAAALAQVGNVLDELEAVRELADTFAETLELAGIEPGAIVDALEALPTNATDEDYSDALRTLTAPLTDAQTRLQEQNREIAAARLGVSLEDLNDVLGDREPVRQMVKGADGKEVEVFGLGEGDNFKPLSEMRAIQAMSSAKTEEKTGVAFPRQTVRESKPEAKTVETRAQELRGQISI